MVVQRKILLIALAATAVILVASVSLYFITQDQKYPIEYDLDGGKFCIDPPETYKSGNKIDLPYPIKDDSAFAGWYTDEDRTVYFDGNTTNLEGDLKLYARWAPSSIGLTIWFDVEGDCNRGLSSYNMVGLRATYYDIQSTRSGLIHTVTVDLRQYEYYDTHNTYTDSSQEEGWGPGLGDYRYDGTETIDTILGKKVCDRYVHIYDDGATETHWIDENGIVFKEYYEYIGDINSDVKSMHFTRTYKEHEEGIITDEYTVTVYRGIGISVTGNKGTYSPGELVTLTAKMEPGATFGGWYGNNLRLLSTDTTYEFEVGFDQTIYAMNSMSDINYYRAGDVINCKGIFDAPIGTWYTSHLNGTYIGNTWNSPTISNLDIGFYVLTAITPDKDHMVTLLQNGGLVNHEYTWKWKGDGYTVNLGIDFEDYSYAKKLYPIEERRQSRPNHERDRTFVTLSYEDDRMSPYLKELADSLIDVYKEKHSNVQMKDYLDYLLAFTQYIQYQTDEEYMGYSEYWKFPLETLYDEGGDCEDTSILFAALAIESMSRLGFEYEVALQILPGHMCAAVKTNAIKGDTNPYGYLYGETTAFDYDIGEIPSKMRDYFLDADYYPKKSYTVEI